jgi:NitT/TauT family transport system substrate-binding protein
MKRLSICLIIPIVLAVLTCTPCPAKESNPKDVESGPVVNFGTLPVLQALPLFVAEEKGYFREMGIAVRLLRFNSAMEKDVALSSGQIAGYFGDMMTPMVLNANNIPVKMVATIFSTPKDQRMFAILASPQRTDKTLPDIAKEGISVSSNTILDYLTTRLLASKGIRADQIKLIEIKNIPLRLQMLLSGQIPAAVLPEPLATLAEQKGARALIDDAGAGISSTVLAFDERFLKNNGNIFTAFLKAVNKASVYINTHHDEVRTIMNRECRVPEPLRKSFPIPLFNKLTVPDRAQVMDVYNWLHEKKIIKKEMTYKQIVLDGNLP